MKICGLILIALVASSCAQINRNRYYNYNRRYDNSGGYVHDNSGSYNDGRYHPDDSGRYRPDGSGAYGGSYEKYKHTADKFGGGDTGAGGFGGQGGFGQGGSGSGAAGGSGGQGGAGSGGAGIHYANVAVPVLKPQQVVVVPHESHSPVNQANVISGTGASAFARPVVQRTGPAEYQTRDESKFGIIRKVENVDLDGYHYLYETENGILAEEQGKLANVGTDNEGMRASGFYTYTGPDNIVYRVEYTADENGFVPSAEHIPTPPPIPEYILRSLEYQRSLGEL